MKKYLMFAKVAWQQALEYRAEGLVYFLSEVFGAMPMICLWLYLQNNGKISSSQGSQLIVYSILSLVISRLTSSNFENWFVGEIKDGKISKNLLKPLSIQLFLFTHEFTNRLNGLIYLLPTLIFASLVLNTVVDMKDILIKFIWITPLLLLMFVSQFFISFIISMAAFWFDQVEPLIHLKWMLGGILGGAWYPLYFMPSYVIGFAKFTPFYYWYFFPIQLINGAINSNEFWWSLMIILVWIIVLFATSQFLWKKAVRHYCAAGSQ